MPLYNASLPPPAVAPGDSVLLFSAEVVTTGQFSQQVAIARKDADNAQRSRLEIAFSAAPGAFDFEVQDSDTDVTADYITVAGAILVAAVATPGGGQIAVLELNPLMGNFARLWIKTQPANNPINVTAKLTR